MLSNICRSELNLIETQHPHIYIPIRFSVCYTLIFDWSTLAMTAPYAFNEILSIGRHGSPSAFIECQALWGK